MRIVLTFLFLVAVQGMVINFDGSTLQPGNLMFFLSLYLSQYVDVGSLSWLLLGKGEKKKGKNTREKD